MQYKTLNNFYSGKEWRGLRLALILERGTKCSRCGKVFKDSQIVGHHTPIALTLENVNDPFVSLNKDNVQLVCVRCHNELENRFGSTKKVFVVYGSPMSGKTTLISQLAGPNDLILDIDKIYDCLSNNGLYNKSQAIKSNVFAVYDLIYDQIKYRAGNWSNAFVVGGFANANKLERIIKELRAEPIFCEATEEECLARLSFDEDKRLYEKLWQKYITDWFDEYNRTNRLSTPPLS